MLEQTRTLSGYDTLHTGEFEFTSFSVVVVIMEMHFSKFELN